MRELLAAMLAEIAAARVESATAARAMQAQLSSMQARSPLSGSPLPVPSTSSGGSSGGGGVGSGGGGGGGGGGVGSDRGSPQNSSRGSRTPRSSPGTEAALAALLAAVAASPRTTPLAPIGKGTDSRALPLETQQRLSVHRLHTPWVSSDFECVCDDARDFTVLSTVGKGLSLFAITCEAASAIDAAHALRGAVTKGHGGCSRRRLDQLPDGLVATFDRLLHGTEAAPIVWHVTLTPRKPMLFFREFMPAFQAWRADPCSLLKAAADVPPPAGAGPEGDSSAEELRSLTPRSHDYVALKLAAAAAQREWQQIVGGSPG